MAQRVICVVGPTASGKTKMGVALAKRFNGEVVSVDSMQIYRGMEIGTAAPTPTEMEGVPHHMIGVADPAESWSVSRFTEAADRCVQDILSHGKLPVLVGGTGLYLDALVRGNTFAAGQQGGAVRQELQERLAQEGAAALLAELAAVDPEAAARLHLRDEKRILRALEVYRETGETISEHDRKSRETPDRYDALYIGLSFRDRQDLRDRIDRRVDAMVAAGQRAAPRRHGLTGHRIQAVFSGGRRDSHRGGGRGGGQAPVKAVRQAAADMAAAKSRHPLDTMGKRA